MNHKKKVAIYLLLLLAVFLLLVLLFVIPLLKDIFSSSGQLATQREKLASIDLLAERYGGFESRYAYYEDKLEDMSELLKSEGALDPEIPIEFINFFKEQAKNYQISLNIIPVEPREDEDFWQVLKFRIKGQGSYGNFMRFLQKLEYSNWFVEVSRLVIGKNSRANLSEDFPLESVQLIDFDLLIKVYVQNNI